MQTGYVISIALELHQPIAPTLWLQWALLVKYKPGTEQYGIEEILSNPTPALAKKAFGANPRWGGFGAQLPAAMI